MRRSFLRQRPIFVLPQAEKPQRSEGGSEWVKIFEASWKPIAAIAVPIAVAISPAIYKSYTFDRGVDGIIAEQALELLRANPDIDGDEQVSDAEKGVRDWAIDVVERYSQVSFPEEARELLRQTASDPEGPVSRTWQELIENSVPCVRNDDVSFDVSVEASDHAMALLEIATSEARDGVTEFCAPERVLEYFRVSASWFAPSPTDDWAASFVGYVISQDGNRAQLRGLGPGVRHIWWSALENDLVDDNFGNLRVGDLMVWVRVDDPGIDTRQFLARVFSGVEKTWGGHLGFVSELSETEMVVIGGNQSNAVTARRFPRNPDTRRGQLVPLGFVRFE